jgi:tRNA modification GTPase
MSLQKYTDTICAIATPPGRGGVAIVRISGSDTLFIAEKILKFTPKRRFAHYTEFHTEDSEILDQGIAIFFPSPNSFTGEDVLELQAHGGHFLVDKLLDHIIHLGARIAAPGEFSERAFLNDKLDLTQAEAIADLIDASSEQAARSAFRTLQGEFSKLIRSLSDSIIELRVYIEAAIDFSEEEIDFLNEGNILDAIEKIITSVDNVLIQARQGSILREGMTVVIAGKPNAGKSSLLNLLSGNDIAIVTDIAGTTRDILNEKINIDGMPLHIIDTAGLHKSSDIVEQEGIRRAINAIESADRILLVVDASKETLDTDKLLSYLNEIGLTQVQHSQILQRLTIIRNKIDLLGLPEYQQELVDSENNAITCIAMSAKYQLGLQLLRQHLKDCMGFQASGEGTFLARRRHLDALEKTHECLSQARRQLIENHAGELVAEDLKHAHRFLGEITGEFTTDELLGKIFSSFCVGK